MTKPKLPKAAIEDLAGACELLSKFQGKPAGQILKTILNSMDKHSSYFFDQPWPENYDYPAATTFTETDQTFLSNKEEFKERYQLMLIKKNIYLNGFQTMGMLIWTPQAYEEQHTADK